MLVSDAVCLFLSAESVIFVGVFKVHGSVEGVEPVNGGSVRDVKLVGLFDVACLIVSHLSLLLGESLVEVIRLVLSLLLDLGHGNSVGLDNGLKSHFGFSEGCVFNVGHVLLLLDPSGILASEFVGQTLFFFVVCLKSKSGLFHEHVGSFLACFFHLFNFLGMIVSEHGNFLGMLVLKESGLVSM